MYQCDHCWVKVEDEGAYIRLAEDADGWNRALLICCYCEDEYEWLEVMEW